MVNKPFAERIKFHDGNRASNRSEPWTSSVADTWDQIAAGRSARIPLTFFISRE
jgi:hypothetical protein